MRRVARTCTASHHAFNTAIDDVNSANSSRSITSGSAARTTANNTPTSGGALINCSFHRVVNEEGEVGYTTLCTRGVTAIIHMPPRGGGGDSRGGGPAVGFDPGV